MCVSIISLGGFICAIFLSGTVLLVNAASNRDECYPENSKKCLLLNSLRAMEKRAENMEPKPPSMPQSATDEKSNGQSYDNEEDQLQALQQLSQMNTPNDRLGDLLDLNSEPAVEDLMRQIMSQAKLWEAIQEANREMFIQKTKGNAKSKQRFPLAFSAQ